MAVYTDVSDADLTRFVAEYEIGEVLSCKGIAEGVENSNYLLTTEYGNFILTLYEKRVNPADLPFFIGLMEHLAARGFSCPTPIHARDGQALRKLCGRPAAIITYLDGLWPRQTLPFHCSGVGDILAQLHLGGADFPMVRPNSLSVADWGKLVEATAERAHEVSPGLAAELATEFAFLERHWPIAGSLPTGICHADLFPDNVFFRDRHVSGVIDFYSPAPIFLSTTSPSASTPGASGSTRSGSQSARNCCSTPTRRSGRWRRKNGSRAGPGARRGAAIPADAAL